MKLNPEKYLLERHGLSLSWMNYKPKHKGQYSIIRRCANDGTFIYQEMLLFEVLNLIGSMQSYYKCDEPNWDDISYIKYTVGDIRLNTYIPKPMKDKPWCTHGDEIILPVSCEYIKKGTKKDKGLYYIQNGKRHSCKWGDSKLTPQLAKGE